MRFALVVSRFNEEIGRGLKLGALEYLRERGVEPAPEDIYEAPGAFEVPLIAQALARSPRDYAGVIALGCVIKGETAHFELISQGASLGLVQATLATGKPISFGILATYDDEQARARSGTGPENKGREAAAACYETVQILKRI